MIADRADSSEADHSIHAAVSNSWISTAADHLDVERVISGQEILPI